MRQVFLGRGVAQETKTVLVAVRVLHPAGLISKKVRNLYSFLEVFFYANKGNRHTTKKSR